MTLPAWDTEREKDTFYGIIIAMTGFLPYWFYYFSFNSILLILDYMLLSIYICGQKFTYNHHGN